MVQIKEFLQLRKLGEYLTGEYADAFYDLFSFVSFLTACLFVLWFFQYVPPISIILRSIRESINTPFSESFLIREMIPSQRVRLIVYRGLMWSFISCMCAAYATSFYYASASIAALLADNLSINRYSAFAILSVLSVFMFFCAYFYMNEANKLARYLHEVRQS